MKVGNESTKFVFSSEWGSIVVESVKEIRGTPVLTEFFEVRVLDCDRAICGKDLEDFRVQKFYKRGVGHVKLGEQSIAFTGSLNAALQLAAKTCQELAELGEENGEVFNLRRGN